MIPIIIQNGMPFVWNATDWLNIREKNRIVGNLTGSLVGLPRQENFQGLPQMLLKEEVTLLIENSFAYTISDSVLAKIPDEKQKEKYILYKEENTKEQVLCYEEQRKHQVTSMIDRIIEGKRRKLLGLNTKKRKLSKDEGSSSEEQNPQTEIVLDREEILKSELNKCSGSAPPSLLVQTFTSDPWLIDDDIEKIDWKFPETDREKLRYSVFKDLWKKGYYITEGHKFGVDYLVYPGDPVKFHAHFLIVCMEYNESFSSMDLISYARLGSISRKTFVIATLPTDSEEIQYQSIQWTENNN